ncbi:MAG: hypothetical protein LBT96_04450 [Campylobacteraceae bacterium]|jgi:hypothetical protein|nr:hypothetical protein [Campylobacteraceae bacterium]
MHSKTVFKVLTALFMLFVLTGCGGKGGEDVDSSSVNGGGLASVSEWDHFPKLNIQVDNDFISHDITRFYKSETEHSDDVNAFKNKGNYTISSATKDKGFYRRNPPSKNKAKIDVTAAVPAMIEGTTIMLISGTFDKSTVRDNALFKELLGYKSGVLTRVYVARDFKKDVTAELKRYAALLEQHGFKKVSTSPWTVEWKKVDTANNRKYSWYYNDAQTTRDTTSQMAIWIVELIDLSKL